MFMKRIAALLGAATATYIAFNAYDTYHFSLTKDPKTNIQLVKEAAQGVFGKGLMADVAASQAILESNLTEKPSRLAIEGNNLFGIKYNPKFDDGYIELTTRECRGEDCGTVNAKFASYKSVIYSFKALNRLYNKANYSSIFKAKNCEEAGKALVKGGYATDPNYAKKVANICYKIQKNLL